VVIALKTSASTPGIPAGWADPLIYDASKYELLHYGPNSIYRNKQALPRAWVVHQIQSVPVDDLEAAAHILSQPAFDPAQMAVIEGSLPARLHPPAGIDTVTFDHYSPNRSKLTANLASSSLLVFSDIYYPGWKVYVDGSPQPLMAANLIMRGVPVPAGRHTVEFVYDPFSFKLGVGISVATLVILGLALVVAPKFTRTPQTDVVQ
jgi:hypothetical protein